MNYELIKLHNLLFLVVFMGFLTLQTSCNKEDDKNSIKGTTWKGTEIDDDYEIDYTIFFEESSFTMVAKIYEDDHEDTDYVNGTYIYNHPEIKLFYTYDDKSLVLSGTISGKKMILYNDTGASVNFTRQ